MDLIFPTKSNSELYISIELAKENIITTINPIGISIINAIMPNGMKIKFNIASLNLKEKRAKTSLKRYISTTNMLLKNLMKK